MSIGHITTLCNDIVTRLQGTTWTSLVIADSDITWRWNETIQATELAEAPKLFVMPSARDRANTSRCTYEDVIRVECVLLMLGSAAIGQATIETFMDAVDDIMTRLDKYSPSPASFRTQTNDPLLAQDQLKGKTLLRSSIIPEYVFDFERS